GPRSCATRAGRTSPAATTHPSPATPCRRRLRVPCAPRPTPEGGRREPAGGGARTASCTGRPLGGSADRQDAPRVPDRHLVDLGLGHAALPETRQERRLEVHV